MAVVRVEFDLQAAEEVQAAKEWYGAQSAAAALSFAEEISAALSRIQEAPDRWPQAIAGTRRHALHKFPFVILYRK
jgi:toxin ParE1/3/4